MHLDAVEAGTPGIERRLAEVCRDLGNFVGFQRTRRHKRLRSRRCKNFTGRLDRGRRNRRFAVQYQRMRNAAYMP